MQSILQEALQGKGAVPEPLETWCFSIRQCNDNLVLGAQRETGFRGSRRLWASVCLR